MAHTSPPIVAPTQANIERAAGLIRAGELVAFPTETVYGLGADATNDRAVAAIFAAKERPRFNPLIVHFATAEDAARTVAFDDRAWRMAAHFWPGALTLVLPRSAESRISALAGAGLHTLAVRVPDQPVAQALLRRAQCPLAAPSANRSGRLSPTTAAHVATDLGRRVALILDGGPCRVGIESTILDLSSARPTLLRPGGVSREDIEALIGPLDQGADNADAPKSPGQLESHYAPRLALRLNATSVAADEALLAFGPVTPDGAALSRNLSPSGDLIEAAAHLFAYLHELDRPDLAAIAVMAVPDKGLGSAINDRLRRAAAERPQ